MMRRQNLQAFFPVILLTSLGIALVGLLVLTPMILAARAGTRPDWPLLANVGEAYGGTATMLSSVAVLGVAASLVLQWRQNRTVQLYSLKQQHLELVKLALDSPEFLYVDGIQADPEGRLKAYANLLVSHWAMAWDLGLMPEPRLRINAARLLRQAVARSWWAAWQTSYLTVKGRRRFVEIMNEEYANAPPIVENVPKWTDTPSRPLPQESAPKPPRPLISRSEGGAFLLGCLLGVAVALGSRVRQRQREPRA